MVTHIEHLFPNLRGAAYQVTSPPDEAYNCIAWAAGDTADCWWPADADISQWPSGVPRVETLDAFRDAFATLQFTGKETMKHQGQMFLHRIELFIDDIVALRSGFILEKSV